MTEETAPDQQTSGEHPEADDAPETAEDIGQSVDENTGPAGATSPPDETKDATRPPSNPEVDDQKVADRSEEFEQAGGGH